MPAKPVCALRICDDLESAVDFVCLLARLSCSALSAGCHFLCSQENARPVHFCLFFLWIVADLAINLDVGHATVSCTLAQKGNCSFQPPFVPHDRLLVALWDVAASAHH